LTDNFKLTATTTSITTATTTTTGNRQQHERETQNMAQNNVDLISVLS